MGIPFVFEFISGLAERGSYGDVAWYWAIFDMINFFQGVFIFFIFVFKDEMRRELAKKYAAFTCKSGLVSGRVMTTPEWFMLI